jgi:hypothetical protein
MTGLASGPRPRPPEDDDRVARAGLTRVAEPAE